MIFMGESSFSGNIQAVKIGDLLKEIKGVNPNFLSLIEESKILKNMCAYRVEYPYGTYIVKKGVLFIPDKAGHIVPLHAKTIDKSVRNALSYQPIPLTLLLESCSEVFLEDNDRVMSLRLFYPGEFFGLFEMFDYQNIENIAATTNVFSGARNAFMLPKISNKKNYKKLNNLYHADIFVPKNYNEHAYVFSQLSNLHGGVKHWKNTAVFFSREFVDAVKSDKRFSGIAYFLLKRTWKESHLRIQPGYNVLWNLFIEAMCNRNLKPHPYLINIAKNILEIMHGCLPGFVPSGKSNAALPVELIQKIFCEHYDLEKYSPTIMVPANFNGNSPVYFSLNYSNYFDRMDIDKYAPSRMADIKELYRLFQTFKKSNMNRSSDNLREINIDFIHEGKAHEGILSSEDLSAFDKQLAATYAHDEWDFCFKNSFMRGCVRIS